MVISIITGLISAACLAFSGFIYKQLKKFIGDFTTLKLVERNDLKAHIVSTYEHAKQRGYITHMELESANRLATSYSSLGGNSYVESLMYVMNHNMEIKGDSIESVYIMAYEQDKDPVLSKKAKDHLEILDTGYFK